MVKLFLNPHLIHHRQQTQSSQKTDLEIGKLEEEVVVGNVCAGIKWKLNRNFAKNVVR